MNFVILQKKNNTDILANVIILYNRNFLKEKDNFEDLLILWISNVLLYAHPPTLTRRLRFAPPRWKY